MNIVDGFGDSDAPPPTAAERLAEAVWLREHGMTRDELLAVVLAERFAPPVGVVNDTRTTLGRAA